MSRAKIQFTENDGPQFWALYEEVARLRHAELCSQAARLRETYPGLVIEVPGKASAAGPLTMQLFTEELRRLRASQEV